MGSLTLIQNPLDPVGSRAILPLVENMTVQDIMDAHLPCVRDEYRVAVALDGILIDDYGIVPGTGSNLALVVVPQGGGGAKDIFKAVALIGLLVGAPYMLAGVSIGTMADGVFTIAGSTAYGTLAVMGTVMVGSLLLNAVLPTQAAGNNQQAQSATYGWDVQSNPVQEGGVVPVLYGKTKIVPPLIGKYVENDSAGNQTINLLYALAGHWVDGIDQVRINGTAHESFSYCNIEFRNGSNALSQQPCMQAFGNTHADVPVGVQLTNTVPSYTVTTVSGGAFTQIAVGVTFPSGLFHINTDGSTGNATVQIQIKYSVHGSGVWSYINESQATTTTTSTTAYWSGGYWGQDSSGQALWVELITGSTVQTDHKDDEQCAVPESVWAVSAYASAYGRPITYWRWIQSTSIVQASTQQVNYITITSGRTSALRNVYYIQNLTAGTTYDICVSLYGTIPTTTDYVNNVFFEYYEEIIEDNLFYPNVALMAIRSFATSQLSGSLPLVDLWVERSVVYVWVPASGAYSALPASNPAWACYDLLHGCRKLMNYDGATYTYQVTGVPASQIVYADFKSWADFCDDTTGSKPKYTCNIYFDTAYTLRKALDIVGLLGRGAVMMKGCQYSCVIERPEQTPVQRFVFNVGNIQQDSFTEEWLSLDNRANAIEVKYRDSSNYYTDTTLQLFSAGYDTSSQQMQKSSVDYMGCTDKSMAAYYGQFLLNCNRYLTVTASWVADIDAIACIPGDIVEVQHDVPQWGYGGRLLAGCTTTTLLLDQSVTMVTGTTYHVIVYHQSDDVREEVAVVNSGATGSTITLSTALSRAPSEYSKWVFGQINGVGKLFRVIKITRNSDLTRKITALEFDTNVFTDGATISPFNPSDLPTVLTPPAPTSITMALLWKLNGRTWSPYVRVTIAYDSAKADIPITTFHMFVHIVDGDTHTQPLSSDYDLLFDTKYAVYDYDASSLNGKTVYANANMENQVHYTGKKCALGAVLYVNTSVNPIVPSQVSVNQSKGSYGYDYYDTNYTVYIKWEPSGWVLTNNLYAPIISWNSGNNWYEFDHYVVVAGWVAAQGNIPAISDLVFYNTPDIGQIYDASGNLITDATNLDAICRAACSLTCQNMGYSSKWIAWTVIPATKTGGTCKLDSTQASYGLDWDWIQVMGRPGVAGIDITTTTVTDFELIYTMQEKSVFLCELAWSYPYGSPDIDGFAVIYRAQSYWWCWQLKSAISSTETSFANIAAAIDLTLGGAIDSGNDFVARYQEWVAKGIPYFYMLISDGSNYELIQVITTTLSVNRGAEGTIACAFGAGATISYSPCEIIDSIATLSDTTSRAWTFNPPLDINFALHVTIAAYKLTTASPGYKRSKYAFWQLIQQR